MPKDTWNQYNRYVILEYKDRYLKDRLGLTAKGYWTQFVRDYSIMLFPPSTLFPAFTDANNKKNVGGFQFGFPGPRVEILAKNFLTDAIFQFQLPERIQQDDKVLCLDKFPDASACRFRRSAAARR